MFNAKQPWFDFQCARYRLKMIKALNNYRNHYSDDNKLQYITTKVGFWELCKRKKKQSSTIKTLSYLIQLKQAENGGLYLTP